MSVAHNEDKYVALTRYLQQCPRDEVLLTYEVIEEFLGTPLSPGAYEHENWWDDQTTHPSEQAASWLSAGWHVKAADITNRWVTFKRTVNPDTYHLEHES